MGRLQDDSCYLSTLEDTLRTILRFEASSLQTRAMLALLVLLSPNMNVAHTTAFANSRTTIKITNNAAHCWILLGDGPSLGSEHVEQGLNKLANNRDCTCQPEHGKLRARKGKQPAGPGEVINDLHMDGSHQ